MITDREVAKQVIQRDIVNLYRQLPQIANGLGLNVAPMLSLFENKILSYADTGVDIVLNWLFGPDNSGNIDEAADIAKMMTNDKIEEYRKRIRQEKAEQS